MPPTTRQFWNPSLPQTLIGAVFLLYANVVLALVFRTSDIGFGAAVDAILRPDDVGNAQTIGSALTVFHLIASAAAGYLIANERKLGWKIGVVVAVIPLVTTAIVVFGSPPHYAAPSIFAAVFSVGFLFEVLLVGLLVHPQSREHQRIWFK